MDFFHRRAIASRGDRPGKTHLIVHFINNPIGLVAETDRFPLRTQGARPWPKRDFGKSRENRGWGCSDHEVAPGRDTGARWKCEIHSAGDAPARNVHRDDGRIVELDEFIPNRVIHAVHMDLVHHHAAAPSSESQDSKDAQNQWPEFHISEGVGLSGCGGNGGSEMVTNASSFFSSIQSVKSNARPPLSHRQADLRRAAA